MTITSHVRVKTREPAPVAAMLAVGAEQLTSDALLICFGDFDYGLAKALDPAVEKIVVRWHPDNLRLRLTQARSIVLLGPPEGVAREIIERHEMTTRRCTLYSVG